MSNNLPHRIFLFVLFGLITVLLIEKNQTGVIPAKRYSRSYEKHPPTLNYPHVGKLADHKFPQAQL